MKTIILARVSTSEQKEANNSLPAQLLRLEKYAKGKRLNIFKEISFDESAFKSKRKEFSKVLNLLKESKETMALCCDKIDRLIRNFTKDLALLEELRKEGKLELHFPSDNIVLHKDSPASDLFRFTIGVSLAKYYSDSISDNVKRAYEAKIKNGEWIGKAPVGYVNISKSGIKDIIPDKERAHLIIRIFELYGSESYSIRQIKEKMKKTSLKGTTANKPLSTGMIYDILKNPFYYGRMRIKGELHDHKYEPLITYDLFKRCEDVMQGYHKKPFKYGAKPFALRGLVKCADPKCGCTITGEIHKGHTYYSCTNYRKVHDKRVYVREDELLEPVLEALDNIKLPEKKIKEVVNDLKNLNQGKNDFHKKEILNLRREYDRIDKRMSGLFDLMADESIEKAMFNKKLKEYKEKQVEINEKLKRYTGANENFYITAEAVLNLARRAKDIFINSEPEEKRKLLGFLLQNCRLNGKKLEFELKTPFDTIIEANRCSSLLRG